MKKLATEVLNIIKKFFALMQNQRLDLKVAVSGREMSFGQDTVWSAALSKLAAVGGAEQSGKHEP